MFSISKLQNLLGVATWGEWCLNWYNVRDGGHPITSVIISESSLNAALYVNPASPPLSQGYNKSIWPYRGLKQRQFFLTSFWHHSDITNGRNIDLWGLILTVKTNNREEILTDKPFLCLNPWVSLGGQDSLWHVHKDSTFSRLPLKYWNILQ